MDAEEIARRAKIERESAAVDLCAPWPVFLAQCRALERRFSPPPPDAVPPADASGSPSAASDAAL
jgi:hypothetical protein